MKQFIALILLMSIVGLVGCNTMEGAGKDISAGGDAVTDTAKDVKRDM
ncbi:MAG: entericidin A/B family lipoprotein [Chromatiaceae bacterium]|nr:entericidin A/B family lipoprotein [Chromatiaceae bacterium]